MRRQARMARQQARIAALRRIHPRPLGGDLLPRARLAAGHFAQVGLIKLLGIDRGRYERELRLGLNDVFRLGNGLHAIEVPPGHEGPWTDYLEEWAL